MSYEHYSNEHQLYLHTKPLICSWHKNALGFIKYGIHLDVGCGSGGFLQSLPKNVIKFGIDLDVNAIKVSPPNMIISHCSIFDFINDEKNHGRFDSISAFEVIEHIEDTAEFIRSILVLLKPNGVFLGSTPNSERLWLSVFPREPFDFPPNHINYFSKHDVSCFLNNLNSVQISAAYYAPTLGETLYRSRLIGSYLFKKAYKRRFTRYLLYLFLSPPVFLFITVSNFTKKKYMHHMFVASKPKDVS